MAFQVQSFTFRSVWSFVVGYTITNEQERQKCCNIINFLTGTNLATPENYDVAAPIARVLFKHDLPLYGFKSRMETGVTSKLRDLERRFATCSGKVQPPKELFALVESLFTGTPVSECGEGNTVNVNLASLNCDEVNYPTNTTFERLLKKSLEENRQYIPHIARCGSHVKAEIATAIDVAKAYSSPNKRPATVEMGFNGVLVYLRPCSRLSHILRDWNRAMSGYIDPVVGPYPSITLSNEERVNDARIELENEKRRTAARAEYEREEQEKTASLETILRTLPETAFVDPDSWEQVVKVNSASGYGSAVLRFSDRWARLMQKGLMDGKSFECVAKNSSFEADIEGITGFMFGCAVSILSKVWIYGEHLRRWHNLKTQIGNEGEAANESGGVLNPALLSIGN